LGCRGHAGAHDRCGRGLAAPGCGLLHLTAHERPREAPCLLCSMTARIQGELVPRICEDAFRYPTADIMAMLSRQFCITIVSLCMVRKVLQHDRGRGRLQPGPQVGHEALQACLRAAACRRRHGKGFWTIIWDVEGTPGLMTDAVEGSPLQKAACCIALRTSGHLKHLAFRAR